MAIDTILEGVGDVASHFVGPLFRGTGWLLLKIATLGTYPPRGVPWDNLSDSARFMIAAVGSLPWLALATWGVLAWL